MGRKIKAERLGIRLPTGFYLEVEEEEEVLLYLKLDGETVAVFSLFGTDFEKVEAEAWQHFIENP